MTRQMTNFIKKSKAFTLLELIIVITIISILSVAGFLVLQKWIGKSRDSSRLRDIVTLKKAFEVNYVDQSTKEIYPFPDIENDGSTVLTGTIGSTELAYKGTIGSGVISQISNISKIPEDPAGVRYEYGVTYDQKEYQIGTMLENGISMGYNYFDSLYAGERAAEIDGKYDNLISYKSGDTQHLSNVPSLIYNGCKFSDGRVNLSSGGVIYMRRGGKNLPYEISDIGSCDMYESPQEVLGKIYEIQDSKGLEVTGINIGDVDSEYEVKGLFSGKLGESFGGVEKITKEIENIGVSFDNIVDNKSCKSILDSGGSYGNGTYEIDPNNDGNGYKVYCDMSSDGGGWTLVGTIADDGNTYWTWHNMRDKNWIYGHEYGNLSDAIDKDFQSKAYADLKAQQILIRHSSNHNMWLRYDGVLSNQTLGSRYPSSIKTVGEFSVDKKSGDNWRYQCGNLNMSLIHGDDDPHDFNGRGLGFVWRNVRNDGCYYDDLQSAIMHYDGNFPSQEYNEKNHADFFDNNFNNHAMNIFVR